MLTVPNLSPAIRDQLSTKLPIAYDQTVHAISERVSFLAAKMYRAIAQKEPDNLHYTVKQNGEFGYYISSHAAFPLIQLLKHFGVTSMLDLGAGAGVLLYVMNCIDQNIHLGGIENEKKLLQHAYSFGYSTAVEIWQGDILDLKPKDLNGFQSVYFWEPFKKEELAKQFADHLAKVLKKNTFVFYQPAGSIGNFLLQHDCFKIHGHYYGLQVFQKQ